MKDSYGRQNMQNGLLNSVRWPSESASTRQMQNAQTMSIFYYPRLGFSKDILGTHSENQWELDTNSFGPLKNPVYSI